MFKISRIYVTSFALLKVKKTMRNLHAFLHTLARGGFTLKHNRSYQLICTTMNLMKLLFQTIQHSVYTSTDHPEETP